MVIGLIIMVLDDTNNPAYIMLMLIVVSAVAMSSFVSGIKYAEHELYRQIRDDVDIKSHKLYRKWLIDNPKEK